MPDIGNALVQPYDTAFAPITGNTVSGGGAYDPSTGKALWATIVGGVAQVWRTIGGYQTLVTEDGSVGYLADITDGSFGSLFNATAHVQRIDGTLYANITGKTTLATTGRMGHWVFIDGSVAKDGTGPWTLHGSVQDEASVADDTRSNAWAGGEVLVVDGIWAVSTPVWYPAFGTETRVAHGISTSTNSGSTWTLILSTNYGTTGALGLGYYQSRSFGRHGDDWYWQSTGNVTANEAWSSPDLITWTNHGSFGFAGSGPVYPFSLGGGRIIYRTWADSALFESSTTPVESPSWVSAFDAGARGLTDSDGRTAPQVFNIGPDHNPLWAAGRRGKVLGIARLFGPSTGFIGFGTF